MSRRPSKIEIYSLEDFQKAPRLDRVRMHMIEPERFELGHHDWVFYQALQQAFMLVSDELREGVAIRNIQSNIPGYDQWPTASRLYRECQQLYAPFVQKNTEIRRGILLERMYAMADAAFKRAVFVTEPSEGYAGGEEMADKEWITIAAKLYADAAKIEGLDQHSETLMNPDELVIPAIEITSDPNAFLEAQTGEDGDYDENEDDDGEDD